MTNATIFPFVGMDKVEGYIHDVSHLGKGEVKEYFDFKLQMESQIIEEFVFHLAIRVLLKKWP